MFMFKFVILIVGVIMLPAINCASILAESDFSKKKSEALVTGKVETNQVSSYEEVRVTQAELMKQYMNESADPCDDFYSYACGNWARYNEIPKHKIESTTFEVLRDFLNDEVKNLLGSNPITENVLIYDDSADQKVKNYFKSCMNYETVEKRGVEPLINLINQFGGWPLLNNSWDIKSFDWLNLTATLRQYKINVFLTQKVMPDNYGSKKNFIEFDQTTLGLQSPSYFLDVANKKYLKSYRRFMIKVITLLGAENANDRADEILKLETRLAKISRAPTDGTYDHEIALIDLQQEIPEINWIRYLTILQERVVDPEEIVIVYDKSYMKNLVKLINSTDSATIGNYLIWRFVKSQIDVLDNRFRRAKETFVFESYGAENMPPRWKLCVSQANSHMAMAVGSLFVRKHFDNESKVDVEKIIYELQKSFREILNESEWIDEKTKLFAEKKLKAMSLKIGYPDIVMSQSALNEYYAKLHINLEKYFENTLNVIKFLTREEQREVSQPVNKTIWQIYPAIAVASAYHSKTRNQMIIPAGILQPPFYHRHFPKNLNYGGIGYVMGHEMTHGFDDRGRYFDESGNFNSWWSDHSSKRYDERSKCLVEQFGNYTMTDIGKSINGKLTLNENIADGGGINQAFRAYKRWLEAQDDPTVLQNEILPELNLTMTQLFFLNFGQTWCGEIRQKANENIEKTAVHSPRRYRVIGALSNFEEFSKEFQCPAGSPMNPTVKCKVW